MPRFRLLLRNLRTANSLSQEELARALQVSRQSIISLERGEYLPSAPVLIALMEFFNCSLPELIEGVNIQTPAKVEQIEQTIERSSPGIGALNLYEQDTHFTIECQLPSFRPEEVSLDVVENTLMITATKAEPTQITPPVRQEWSTSQIERAIRFESPIESSAIEAKLENGILTVVAPKATPEEPKTTRIQIKHS